jgi:hypothetical protein
MTPWDDLPEYEVARIAALPSLDEIVAELYRYAPKASAADMVEALGNEYPKSVIRAARDRAKAAAKGEPEAFVPTVPTRDAVLKQLRAAIDLNNAKEADRWARSLAALSRAGDVDPAPETTEEWDRLSDLEAGILIALTRKLNGEALTEADGKWLARLR